MVEAAGVVDQVVRAAQCGADEGEGVTAEEADRCRGLGGPVPGPGEGRRREVDRVHLEARGGEVERVAARAAAQVEGAPRGEQPAVEPGDEVLVGLGREERHRLGAVRVEAVPPGGRVGGPAVGLRCEQAVQEREYIVEGAQVAVHQVPFPGASMVGLEGAKAQVRRYGGRLWGGTCGPLRRRGRGQGHGRGAAASRRPSEGVPGVFSRDPGRVSQRTAGQPPVRGCPAVTGREGERVRSVRGPVSRGLRPVRRR